MSRHFLVNRDDLTQTQWVEEEDQTPGPGEVLLRVDRFALTANNVTYGVAGDIIGYWQFFPAAPGWGKIPVWGIGTVVTSEHPNIETGDRYYGYFPMASELLVKPEKISSRGFTDAAEHRASLPVVYNQYSLMSADNGFDPSFFDHYMLYRPLFTTSFVLDDYFADQDFFGANTLILGSASSKTAFGMAFLLKQRPDIKVVGLTSKANVSFVEGLGLYDTVLTYDRVTELAQTASAYVDMAGNREVLSAVHHHLNDHLKYSCGVGMTHWSSRTDAATAPLPGAKPAMFFAPTQIIKRHEELGAETYQQRIHAATASFLAAVDAWVTIEAHSLGDTESVYRTVLQGTSPQIGHILTNG